MQQAMTPPMPPQGQAPVSQEGQAMPPQGGMDQQLPPEPAPGQQPLEGLPPVMAQGGMQAPMDPNAPPQEMMR